MCGLVSSARWSRFTFVLLRARGARDRCEGALLELEAVPATLCCEVCRQEWELDAAVFRCPFCGCVEVRITSGDELEVESIEIEEEACIASG